MIMRMIMAAMTATLMLMSAAAQNVQSLVDKLDSQEPLRSSSWGVLAVDGHGRTLASLNPQRKLSPASNMKLITTGLAIKTIGPDYCFHTHIGYDGTITDGVLHGDLYIIGGGDPTLATSDSIATDYTKVFAEWKQFLKKEGIRSIDGLVIGDGRLFDEYLENSSWNYDDIATYYGTGSDALMFYANTIDYAVTPGKAVGNPVNVAPIFPRTPWLKIDNLSTTSPAGTDNTLYFFTTDFTTDISLRGQFPISRKSKTENASNKYGALTCAYYFNDYLNASGISTGGYADIDRHNMIRTGPGQSTGREAASHPTSIGFTLSPTVSDIARETNHRSDNLYAETLLRTLSLHKTGSASYDSCHVAITRELEELGVSCEGRFVHADGSGLSRLNLVTPEFMVDYLKAMHGTFTFVPFVISLPSPGSNGTMRSILPGLSQSVKSRIRLKSGSMSNILCYSGYILPSTGKRDDTIYFSILVNNCDAPFSILRPEITSIIAALAENN